jgi:sugar phosphate isomerase/epimerase
MYTRRDIGRFAVSATAWGGAALIGTRAFGATTDPAAGVRFGATTWSLRDLPRIPGKDNVDDLIKPLKSAGVTEIDLWSYNTEPAGPNFGPGAPPPPAAYPVKIKTFSKEEIEAANIAVRKLLHDFRLNTPAGYYEDVRAKFRTAGINVVAYTVRFDNSFSDEEIAATFQQAKALGASSITSPGAADVVKRLVPFAEKYEMNVALTDFAVASALPSKRFKVNADIGAITAANSSPVAWLQENHDAVAQLTVKDRRRNKGKNEQFGEGDTPINDVLRLVKDKQYSFPVFAEYEYLGLGTPAEELQRCMDYMRSAIA